MPKSILVMLCVVATLSCMTGCLNVKQEGLTVRGGGPVVYQCDNGDRIVARYYSLSDASLQFVKVLLPDGEGYTLPLALSASGARYTDDRILTWWIKGHSARVEIRDQNGEWQTKYKNCQEVSDFPQNRTGRTPEDTPVKGNSENPGDTVQKGPSVIETPEIVRILEEERIESVATTHSQTIYIRLKDGREYKGTYVHAQAGRYSDDDHLFDILNLVSHIKKKRPPEEVGGWNIMCE
ncbi:MliC family protein [Thermodesulfobacteriota bacterium]